MASDLQKGSEMQQSQREAFLAKFRNWAGKPLGQNFAPQGEGKKKKKKKKKKSGRRPLFFFFFFFFFFPLVGTLIKKMSALRAAAHEATTRPSRGGVFSAPNPKSEPLGYHFLSRDRAVRLFSCFLRFSFDCHPEGHCAQVPTVTAYPS